MPHFPGRVRLSGQSPCLPCVCIATPQGRHVAVRSLDVTTLRACCAPGLSPGEHLRCRQGLAQVPCLSNKSRIHRWPCSLNIAKIVSQIPQYITPRENPIRNIWKGWMLTELSHEHGDIAGTVSPSHARALSYYWPNLGLQQENY